MPRNGGKAQVDAGSGACIALDVGNSAGKLALWHGDRPLVIANETGNRSTPAVVAFTDEEELVGEAAVRKAAKNARNTVTGWRRVLGLPFDSDAVRAFAKTVPFKLGADKEGNVVAVVSHKEAPRDVPAVEIASMVFGKLKATAEGYLGGPVTAAVLSVPTHFDEAQRTALCDACRAAGMAPVKLVNEAAAAAIAFGVDRPAGAAAAAASEDAASTGAGAGGGAGAGAGAGSSTSGATGSSAAAAGGVRKVVVFDMGGSSLTVSVLAVVGGLIQRLVSEFDESVSGAAFDDVVAELCQAEFKRRTRMRVEGVKSLTKLRAASEGAKRALSTQLRAHIEVDSLFEGIDFGYNVSRVRFEYGCGALLRGTKECLGRAMGRVASQVAVTDVDEVLLVGGASRIPCVRKEVAKFFGPTVTIRSDINPEEAGALGLAAEVGALIDHTEVGSGEVSREVAVLSKSLRLAGQHGSAVTILARGAALPCRRRVTLAAAKGQSSLLVTLLEGERGLAAECTKLAELPITGVAAGATISLVLSVATDGSMLLAATERATDASWEVSVPAPAHGGDRGATAAAALLTGGPDPAVLAADEAAVAGAKERIALVATSSRIAKNLRDGAKFLEAWSATQRSVLAAGSAAAEAWLAAHPEGSAVSAEEAQAEHEKLKNAFKAAAMLATAAAAASAAAAAAGDEDDDSDDSDDDEDDDEDESDDEDDSSSEEEVDLSRVPIIPSSFVAPPSDELD